MKIVIIDDSLIAKEAPKELKDIGHEVFGIYMAGFPEIYSSEGEVKMSLMEAVQDADVIFLDHNMPTPGDELLQQLRKAGLVIEKTRVVGISSGGQDYLKEHTVWRFLIDKPEAIKRLIEK